MNRPVSEDELHAYVDGVLPEARRIEVQAYLADHPPIAARFGQFAEQRDALRAALGPIAAEPVPPQLNLTHLLDARRQTRWAGWRTAVAACLLLIAGGAGGWLLRGGAAPSTGIAALAGEASYAYAVYGADRARAVEISADNSQTLVRWLEQRLDRPVAVPNLQQSGFQLLGGRVVATQNGAAGLLMYDDAKGNRIAILMRPMVARDHDARMAPHREGNVTGFSWADSGMGYSLVGREDAQMLHPLADEARRQFLSRT